MTCVTSGESRPSSVLGLRRWPDGSGGLGGDTVAVVRCLQSGVGLSSWDHLSRSSKGSLVISCWVSCFLSLMSDSFLIYSFNFGIVLLIAPS